MPDQEWQEMARAGAYLSWIAGMEGNILSTELLLTLTTDKEEQQKIAQMTDTQFRQNWRTVICRLVNQGEWIFDRNSPLIFKFDGEDQKVVRLKELRELLIKGFEELSTQQTEIGPKVAKNAANIVIAELFETHRSVKKTINPSRGQDEINATEFFEDIIGNLNEFLRSDISILLPEQKEVARRVMKDFFSKGFPEPKKPETPLSSQSLKGDDGETKTTEQEKFREDTEKMHAERIKREAEEKEPQEKKPEEKKGDSRDHKEEELNQRPEVIGKGEVAESKTPSARASSDKSELKTPTAESEKKPLTEREKVAAARVEYYKNNQTTPPSSKESDQKPSSEIEPASSKQVQGTEQRKGGAMWERR